MNDPVVARYKNDPRNHRRGGIVINTGAGSVYWAVPFVLASGHVDGGKTSDAALAKIDSGVIGSSAPDHIAAAGRNRRDAPEQLALVVRIESEDLALLRAIDENSAAIGQGT